MGDVKGVLPDSKLLQLRLTWDISKHLRCGISTTKNGAPLFLAIKFEKLLDFCYKCGMLTHVEECMEVMETKFGPWLQARGRSRNREARMWFPNCCSFGKVAWLDTYDHGSSGSLELVAFAILVEDSNLVTYLALVATDIPPSSILAPFSSAATITLRAFKPRKGVVSNKGHQSKSRGKDLSVCILGMVYWNENILVFGMLRRL